MYFGGCLQPKSSFKKLLDAKDFILKHFTNCQRCRDVALEKEKLRIKFASKLARSTKGVCFPGLAGHVSTANIWTEKLHKIPKDAKFTLDYS